MANVELGVGQNEHPTRKREPMMKGPGLFIAGYLVETSMIWGGRRQVRRPSEGPALDLADIQGFILRGYRMPMVRHFLLTVGTPAQARRQLGRLVSGDESDVPQITTAGDWHVEFEPGPGDDPAATPRRKPDYCLNIGITWPGLVAPRGCEATRPGVVVQVIWCVHRRSRATSGAGRRHWAKLARELGCRFREGAGSRPGDAARYQPGSDGGLQRQGACLVCRRRCLPGNLAPGRGGADGDARWQTSAHVQSSLRIYRRNHLPHHSRRPGRVSARSPAALRAMALRLAGRSGELRRTRAARTRPERQLRGFQEGRD